MATGFCLVHAHTISMHIQALFPSHKEPADEAIVCTCISTHSLQVTITGSGVDVYVHTWQTLGQVCTGMTLISTVIGEQHIDHYMYCWL